MSSVVRGERPTIYVPFVEKLPAPREKQRFGKSVDAYDSELQATARRLGQLTNLDPSLLQRVAYEIVGQEIIEDETRLTLAAKYAQTPLELGRTSMRMLDGGIGQCSD